MQVPVPEVPAEGKARDTQRWTNRMVDRMALIAARAGSATAHSALSPYDALVGLRIGYLAGELHLLPLAVLRDRGVLERTIRHTKDCPKCARGEGHRVFVLTVSYGGGRTRQFSVRRERVTEVRRLLANYQKLKKAIEGICELNHELLRPDAAASKSRRKQHD